MGPPLRGFWLPDVRPRIQHCRRARPELRSVMPDVRCCASGCARKSKVCREVVRCAVPEVPGDQTGRFSTCATRARITRTINPELRDRAPERLTTRHAQPRNSRDAFQELRAWAPDGAARPGIPNLGIPTFAGKSSDPEIPPPMEAAGLVHPGKNLPGGAGPLLGWLANLRKENPGLLVYNTI